MRTVRVKVFKFNELSDKAKAKARDWWRDGETYDYLWQEAQATLEEFCELFNIRIRDWEHGSWDWKHDQLDEVERLSGRRLATYLWNNYRSGLYKGKWYKSWSTGHRLRHTKVKSTEKKSAGWRNIQPGEEYWNVYRGLKLERSCVLTGVCYDEDILAPIYRELDTPTGKQFRYVISECIKALYKSVEKETEWRNEDAQVDESILANEYEFTGDGKHYV